MVVQDFRWKQKQIFKNTNHYWQNIIFIEKKKKEKIFECISS